ncbi:MAG: cell division inhibitor SulA [Flavobacteriales bacterium]|jgi:cell division inhibitor SulA
MISARQNTQTRQFAPTEFNLSEVLIPQNNSDQSDLVYPMIAHLSRKSGDRWLTWVGAKNLNKSLIEEYGFSAKNVRIINCEDDNNLLATFWDALHNGTSAYVVCSLHEGMSLDARQKEYLKHAAKNGNAQGLILSSVNSAFNF